MKVYQVSYKYANYSDTKFIHVAARSAAQAIQAIDKNTYISKNSGYILSVQTFMDKIVVAK